MRRLFVLLVLLALTASSFAEKSYLAMYMNGSRIGYVVSEATPDTQHGAATRSDSRTVMSAGLLGSALDVTVTSKTWSDALSKPVRMEFEVVSSGRAQKTQATFTTTGIDVEVDNNGAKSSKTLNLPKDGKVVDDAITALFADGGTGTKIYYVFDPMTVSLVKNEVKSMGTTTVVVKGQSYGATKVLISEPRANTYVYLTPKGDLVKVDGPMGIEMIPCTEEEALKPADVRTGSTDLAYANALRPIGAIPATSTVKRLRLEIKGGDLKRLPNDAHQSLKQLGEAKWVLEVHPVKIDFTTTIAEALAQKPDWVKPSQNIGAEDPTIKEFAAKAVGDAKTVAQAARNARDHVFGYMRPNASIGVLRDAAEVLRTREGVCRDYATLMAATMRAANVPTRLVSGLVLQDGQYFYHAWVEVWDGRNWCGVDATLGKDVDAGYLKLAEGNVEDAFTFTLLERVTIKVLRVARY